MSKPALEFTAQALDLAPDGDTAVEDAAPPPARPGNLKRSLFHIASGLVALALLRWLPGREWLIAVSCMIAVSGWTCEIARKRSPALNARVMRLFAPVAHANEHTEVNSSTWYVTALVLLALFAPLRAAEIGVVVLAFADPAAGVIGRRWGRTKIFAGRSLEGSLAFVAVGTLTAGAWLAGAHGVAVAPALIIAGAGAILGALAEMFVTRLDDNFAIPVAATTAAAVALAMV